jgi:molybdopterin-synthase adenylyltransferase
LASSSLNANSPFFHEERHASIQAWAEKRLTICGAGALGGNVTEMLARMGCNQLRVIDRDRVELRNLSTQPYSRGEVGASKARALATMLYRATQAKIEPVSLELTTENAEKLLGNSQLIIEAFDNRAARAAVSVVARAQNIPCLHIGFSADGLYGNGIWEPEYQIPGEAVGDPCDYPLTRPFALLLTSIATRSVVDFLRSGQRRSFEITWNDLKLLYGDVQ